MASKKKTELSVAYIDKRTKTQVFKAVAALAGVDEVKIEQQKVIVIGEVDPAKLSSEIKKVGLKESCFGYVKGGKELSVEILTVGKAPEEKKVDEKPKCQTCTELCCATCKKCHNSKCKDCVRCCCVHCQKCPPSAPAPPPSCCDPLPPPPVVNPYCNYKGGYYPPQIVEVPPYYDYGGGGNGCSIL